MRIRLPLLLLPAALALAGCDPGGTGPSLEGGTFHAVLESPNGPEGAALLQLEGTGITSVTAMGGVLAGPDLASAQKRMVVIREPAGTLEFRVVVAPGNETPTVQVLQVAGGDDVLRGSLNGYRVTLTREVTP